MGDVPTFRIGRTEAGHEYIECLRCRRKSFNKNDIEKKYCGNDTCGFHSLMENKNEEGD